MENCIFCKIAAKEMQSDVVYETDKVLAFRDIDPKSPVHILIIPKVHISSLNDLEDASITHEIIQAARKIAAQEKIDLDGYRIINNIGENGGQTVSHLHFHLMGGRKMGWPPG